MTLRYQPLGRECTSTFIDLKANPMVRGGRGEFWGHYIIHHYIVHQGNAAVLFFNHAWQWQAGAGTFESMPCEHAVPVRHLRLHLVPRPRLLACTQRLCPCLVHSMHAAPRGCGGSRLFPGPRLGPGHLRHGAAGQAHLGQGGRGGCGHRLVWTQRILGSAGYGYWGSCLSWDMLVCTVLCFGWRDVST